MRSRQEISIPSKGKNGHSSTSFKDVRFNMVFYKNIDNIPCLNIKISSDKKTEIDSSDPMRGIYTQSVTKANAYEIKKDHIYNILLPAYKSLKKILNTIPQHCINFVTEKKIKESEGYFEEASSKFNVMADPKQGYLHIETTGERGERRINEPEMEYSNRTIIITGIENILEALNQLRLNGILTDIAKPKINQALSEIFTNPDIKTATSEESDLDKNKIALITAINDAFGDKGAYKNRWFITRDSSRDVLITELLQYANNPETPYENIIGKLESVGKRAQKDHEDRTGSRFMFWRINETCGFKKVTDALIQKYKNPTVNVNESTLLNFK